MSDVKQRAKRANQQPKQDRRMLTARELAEMFSVCELTIHRWHHAGILPPAMRLNRRIYRWCSRDIERFIAGRTKGD